MDTVNFIIAVCSVFFSGLTSGVAVGLFLSPSYTAFRQCKFTAGREDRLRKEQERKAEAQRRLEACRLRKTEKRIAYGIYWDREGTPYCPVCKTAMHPFSRVDGTNKWHSGCYACEAANPGSGHRYCHLPDSRDLMTEIKKCFEEH